MLQDYNTIKVIEKQKIKFLENLAFKLQNTKLIFTVHS